MTLFELRPPQRKSPPRLCSGGKPPRRSRGGNDWRIAPAQHEYEVRALKGGAPDFGTIHITYVPGDLCLELKSLKLYLWSFRDDGIFYERAVNRILDDLSRACNPRWMEVVGDFNIRGGIKSVIRARVGAKHA